MQTQTGSGKKSQGAFSKIPFENLWEPLCTFSNNSEVGHKLEIVINLSLAD